MVCTLQSSTEEVLGIVPIKIPSLWLSVDRISITLSHWGKNHRIACSNGKAKKHMLLSF